MDGHETVPGASGCMSRAKEDSLAWNSLESCWTAGEGAGAVAKMMKMSSWFGCFLA